MQLLILMKWLCGQHRWLGLPNQGQLLKGYLLEHEHPIPFNVRPSFISTPQTSANQPRLIVFVKSTLP